MAGSPARQVTSGATTSQVSSEDSDLISAAVQRSRKASADSPSRVALAR